MKKNKRNKKDNYNTGNISGIFAKRYIYYYYGFFWLILVLYLFVK